MSTTEEASRRYAAEAARIRIEYENRRAVIPEDRYHLRHPVNFFFSSQTERAVLNALNDEGMFPLENKTIVDVGCGRGDWLLEFIRLGARGPNLSGIDLDERRIAIARERIPAGRLICGDATSLPWPDESVDMVTQFTMFTSILDRTVKAAAAAEMVRIVRPGGIILWYDFCYDNPSNPGVQGIRPAEIRTLFAGLTVRFRRTTLAPPLARAVVPFSWIAGILLDCIPLLRTHCLAVIRK